MAGSACPVRTTTRLAPQPEAQNVAWTLVVFDRCTGELTEHVGAAVTALAGWPYEYATSWLQLPAGHPLAVVGVAFSPVHVASSPLLFDDNRSC